MENMNLAASTAVAASMAGLLDEQGRLNAFARRPYIARKTGESRIVVNQGDGKYGSIRTNQTALLQYDEWKDIDRAVIQAAVQRMIGISDLRARGLTHNLGSIGLTISLWDRASDITPADVSMSAVTRGEKDTQAFRPQQVPVPIVHKDFQIELRRLVASRRFGESLDTSIAALASRRVAERSEQMLFGGVDTIQVDGSVIYGYTTHPDRNTVDLAANWDLSTTTGADILADVQEMLNAARDDRHYGPFVIYVPTAYESKLDDDYRDMDNRTIRQRILALSGIEDIRVADFLEPNNVLLVQMTTDVVDLAIAQDITTVQWQVLGGMQEEFKVMAVWVPRIKSDFDGRSGIVHLRPAP